MGTLFREVKPDAEALRDLIENTNPGGLIMWIVGRYETAPDPDAGHKIKGGIIHLQGVADDEQTAIAMCRSADYFIAPLPVNVLLPEKPVEWFGLYWPLRNVHPGDVTIDH